MSIYEALEDVSLSGGIHSITLEVMYCMYLVYRNREISKLSQDLKEGNITSSVYIAKVRILLASSLDAKSKNGNKLDVMYYIKSLDRSKENNLGLSLDTMISPVYLQDDRAFREQFGSQLQKLQKPFFRLCFHHEQLEIH